MSMQKNFGAAKDKTVTEKRKNLMSIVNFLHEASLGNGNPEAKDSSITDCSSQTQNVPREITSSFLCKETPVSEFTMEEGLSPRCEEASSEKDVMSNILRLLYQVANQDHPPQTEESTSNDSTILEMQHPPVGNKAGILPLLTCFANGTPEVKSVLKNDINIIYECKRCRGMFRALPNLIRHKKEFCRNTGALSSFLNRETNSTKEEDFAFQKVLSVLHPPEPFLARDMPSSSTPPGKSIVHVATKLPPVKMNLVKIPSQNSVAVNGHSMANTSGPSRVPRIIGSTRTADSSNSGSMKFTVTQPVPEIREIPYTPPRKLRCPVCNKQMAERKNIRRHLVSVHMFSVVEAVKALNKAYPPMKGQSSGKVTPSLLSKCVETIRVGPNRVVNVLPEDYSVSSSKCPVCSHVFCRKTNVKRHILEAHNLIIKGARKYHLLKDIVAKKKSPGTSLRLRALRVMLSPEKTLSNSENKSSQNFLEVDPTGSTSTYKSLFPHKSHGGVTESVDLNSIKFVESGAPVFQKNSTKTPEANPKSMSYSSPWRSNLQGEITEVTKSLKREKDSSQMSPSSEALAENNSAIQDLDASPESGTDENGDSNLFSVSSFKCISCNKSFGRSQTFKNHMSTFHKCSGEDFERLCKNQKVSRTSLESRRNKRRSQDDDDRTPPKKSQKILPKIADPSKASQFGQTNHSPVSRPKIVPFSPLPNGSSQSTTTQSNNFILKSLTPKDTAPISVSPLFRVQLKNSASTSKSQIEAPFMSKKLQSSALVRSPPVGIPKYNTSFDLRKLTCYSCGLNFKESRDLKRHLIQLHSFSAEDAFAASYDSSDVSEEDQRAGLEHGFDIALAKCLTCDRLYFSRENLARHLMKFHHLQGSVLNTLRVGGSLSNSKKAPSSGLQTAPHTNSRKENAKINATPFLTTDNKSEDVLIKSGICLSVIKNTFTVSEECTAQALRILPKKCINATQFRCHRCKNKYRKAWDLKMHVLKHLDLGLFACKFCPRSGLLITSRSVDLLKHLVERHQQRVTNKTRNHLINQCRVDLKNLWKAYDIPHCQKEKS